MNPRKPFLQQRKSLSDNDRRYFAKRANLALAKLRPHLPRHANVALYQDSFGELPTFGIVQFCQRHSLTPYLPIIKKNKLMFAPITLKGFAQLAFCATPQKHHRLGMHEPIRHHVLPISQMHACICPLVAVDKAGVRMGMGGGFYDRTLVAYQGIKIGWCYDFQRTQTLPKNPWDVCMDIIITPSGLFYC